MAASVTLGEDNGAATGSPPKGTTRTDPASNVNWKNIDDASTVYYSSPITRGNNSYNKWMFLHFSGSYNQISAGLFAHTAGVFGGGLTLKNKVAPGANTYTTPATAANANLTVDITAVIAIGAGQAVLFGATGPEAAGKAASTAANPAYTQWIAFQLQTTVAAATGDTVTSTFTVQWDES